MDFGYNRYPLFLSYSNFVRISRLFDQMQESRFTVLKFQRPFSMDHCIPFDIRFTRIHCNIRIYTCIIYYIRTYLKACANVSIYLYLYTVEIIKKHYVVGQMSSYSICATKETLLKGLLLSVEHYKAVCTSNKN